MSSLPVRQYLAALKRSQGSAGRYTSPGGTIFEEEAHEIFYAAPAVAGPSPETQLGSYLALLASLAIMSLDMHAWRRAGEIAGQLHDAVFVTTDSAGAQYIHIGLSPDRKMMKSAGLYAGAAQRCTWHKEGAKLPNGDVTFTLGVAGGGDDDSNYSDKQSLLGAARLECFKQPAGRGEMNVVKGKFVMDKGQHEELQERLTSMKPTVQAETKRVQSVSPHERPCTTTRLGRAARKQRQQSRPKAVMGAHSH